MHCIFASTEFSLVDRDSTQLAYLIIFESLVLMNFCFLPLNFLTSSNFLRWTVEKKFQTIVFWDIRETLLKACFSFHGFFLAVIVATAPLQTLNLSNVNAWERGKRNLHMNKSIFAHINFLWTLVFARKQVIFDSSTESPKICLKTILKI